MIARRVAARRLSYGRAHLQCRRATPLRRPGSPYGEAMQLGKERNVALVAPAAEFSWHRYVGPPLRSRGFVPGPEIRAGKLQEGKDVVRENQLWRVRTGADGTVSEERVAENRAIVLYPVPELTLGFDGP